VVKDITPLCLAQGQSLHLILPNNYFSRQLFAYTLAEWLRQSELDCKCIACVTQYCRLNEEVLRMVVLKYYASTGVDMAKLPHVEREDPVILPAKSYEDLETDIE
jgi:hypothetical protein